MERIDPIRGDIAELRHSVDQLKQSMEQRFALQEATTNAAIRTAIETQTRFFFVAWAVILAAIVGLYSR